MNKKIDLKKGQNELYDIDPTMPRISQFKIDDINPGDNPRSRFDKTKLAELAESIKKHGVLQPIIVESDEEGGYKIIAGERRWRASKLAGKTEIIGILKNNANAAEIALIENVQREDLTPLEEALGYQALMDKGGYSQGKLGEIVGKKRNTVNEILSIMRLPGDILEQLVDYPNVSKNHLIQIAQEKDEKKQRSLWAKARSGLLTVAETKQVRQGKKPTKELSQAEKAVRTITGGITRLEKIDELDALSIEELKTLRTRITRVLNKKSEK